MRTQILDLLKYFFRLGIVAFGGPAAHVAMMQRDLVEDKKWLTDEEFLDYMGATNLIPGPNSTEMTMHVGHHKAGWKGVFVAGFSFILPAVLITLIIAIGYTEVAQFSWAQPILLGIKAAVISFIAGAILKLGKKAIKSNLLAVLGIAVALVAFFGVNEVLCILGAGIIMILIYFIQEKPKSQLKSFFPLTILALAQGGTSLLSISSTKIFLVFLKVGAVLFGSGYVLFAYLDGELVQNLGWLMRSDLIDAIAVGQITPGPVLSTSTFVGYKLGGISGAFAATLGIFLPSFLYVILLNPLIHKMRKSAALKKFLSGVNVAAVAVMVVVTVEMLLAVVFSNAPNSMLGNWSNTTLNWKAMAICALSFFVYFRFKKLSPIWIVLGGGLLGWLLSFI